MAIRFSQTAAKLIHQYSSIKGLMWVQSNYLMWEYHESSSVRRQFLIRHGKSRNSYRLQPFLRLACQSYPQTGNCPQTGKRLAIVASRQLCTTLSTEFHQWFRNDCSYRTSVEFHAYCSWSPDHEQCINTHTHTPNIPNIYHPNTHQNPLQLTVDEWCIRIFHLLVLTYFSRCLKLSVWKRVDISRQILVPDGNGCYTDLLTPILLSITLLSSEDLSPRSNGFLTRDVELVYHVELLVRSGFRLWFSAMQLKINWAVKPSWPKWNKRLQHCQRLQRKLNFRLNRSIKQTEDQHHTRPPTFFASWLQKQL